MIGIDFIYVLLYKYILSAFESRQQVLKKFGMYFDFILGTNTRKKEYHCDVREKTHRNLCDFKSPVTAAPIWLLDMTRLSRNATIGMTGMTKVLLRPYKNQYVLDEIGYEYMTF